MEKRHATIANKQYDFYVECSYWAIHEYDWSYKWLISWMLWWLNGCDHGFDYDM